MSCTNLSDLISLISVSTCWVSVENYVTSSFSLFTCTIRKWNLISMCLLLSYEIEFLVKLIVDLLLTNNLIGFSASNFNSSSNESSQITCDTILSSRVLDRKTPRELG